ncbi:hypothetical protein SAMN05421780_110107 [Flexibacter flexilis DSM 6793]|uniref:Uncharacterized protein n=1 Tax=Flexibacter flexilis DSM 6793 TaxID=927664 RepID=A0A1I1MAS0_9BACT|nr:hypothetical protein SAMN05421780_110107 [Flexibacter flexilis DSM 6793]
MIAEKSKYCIAFRCNVTHIGQSDNNIHTFKTKNILKIIKNKTLKRGSKRFVK